MSETKRWKATVTDTEGTVTTEEFESYASMLSWLEEHHGQYTGVIAAEIKD